jgi:hypothetical protein
VRQFIARTLIVSLSHASWKSRPDSPFEFPIAAFDRPRCLQGVSSVQPEQRSIVFAQMGRLPEKLKGLPK